MVRRALPACSALFLALAAVRAPACPFCTALGPTLAARRDAAQVVALGEVTGARGQTATVRVHQVLKGQEKLTAQQSVVVPSAGELKAGSLVLLFGPAPVDEADVRYELEKVSETGFGYFAQAPALRIPTAQRLTYFVRYLEHADPRVAEDAYREFGHASYDEVRAVADRLPMDKLRRWVRDPGVPQARQGFYGLALGLAQTDADRRANAELLRQLIVEPDDDFRAGFDGVLGGYLILSGEPGLRLIEAHILDNSRAAAGDVRHALTALRFYHEFGHDIAVPRLARALRRLLNRPELADRVIIDLARWQDWTALPEVVALYGQVGYATADVRKAIVGYLKACPEPHAAAELRRLRGLDAAGIEAAERDASPLGGARQ